MCRAYRRWVVILSYFSHKPRRAEAAAGTLGFLERLRVAKLLHIWLFNYRWQHVKPFQLRSGVGGEPIAEGGLTRRDGKSVFLETETLQPVMQMEIKYSLNTADGAAMKNQLWLTPNRLDAAKRAAMGRAHPGGAEGRHGAAGGIDRDALVSARRRGEESALPGQGARHDPQHAGQRLHRLRGGAGRS